MSAAHPFAKHHRLVPYFFFAVFLFILWEMALLLSPFYVAVLGAAIVALLVHPLHERVRASVAGPAAAAAVTTLLSVLLIVLPSLFFAWAFLKDAERLYPAASGWLEDLRRLEAGETHLAGGALDTARRWLALWHLDLEDIALKNLAELRGDVGQLAASAIANTVFVLMNVVLLAFTLFFFLRDGDSILGRVVELVPMAPAHKEAILGRLRDTLVGLVRGVFGLAIAQGFLCGVGFAVVGVPLPALLGMLTTLLSPIPFLGILGVLAPVAIAMALAGSTAAGLAAGLWCLGAAILVERVLRPLVVAPENEIPVLLLFFGLLGGVRVYGPVGVLLGPVLIALTLAFVNVYRQEYRWLLAPEER